MRRGEGVGAGAVAGRQAAVLRAQDFGTHVEQTPVDVAEIAHQLLVAALRREIAELDPALLRGDVLTRVLQVHALVVQPVGASGRCLLLKPRGGGGVEREGAQVPLEILDRARQVRVAGPGPAEDLVEQRHQICQVGAPEITAPGRVDRVRLPR
ncbi:hypothetical protein [Streptomyces californicus]